METYAEVLSGRRPPFFVLPHPDTIAEMGEVPENVIAMEKGDPKLGAMMLEGASQIAEIFTGGHRK
jgi:hypothetical protein